MEFIKIKTRKFLPPQDDIFGLLEQSLSTLKEGDVLFIASKILAIHQGRCVKVKNRLEKIKLIREEADFSLPQKRVAGSDIVLTIKNLTLIPSAGIDESNGNGYLVLWPKNPCALCRQICNHLKKKYRLKKLAVIATDSHTTPLRWGVSGICIGFWGLKPLRDRRGQKDVFGKKLKYTQSNVVDSLSAMAVLLMGEGDERIPIILLRKAQDLVRFSNQSTFSQLTMSLKRDLYFPLVKIFQKHES